MINLTIHVSLSVLLLVVLSASLSNILVVSATNNPIINDKNEYLGLSDLKGFKTYIFNVMPADGLYGNKILSITGLPQSNHWIIYHNPLRDYVYSTSISIGGYRGLFKITSSGYVYYKLARGNRFPPLINNISRDIDLIRRLLSGVVNITGNISVKYAGIAGTIRPIGSKGKIVWSYDTCFNPHTGKWISKETTSKYKIINRRNTYIVKIGNLSWPYKISIRWGEIDGSIKPVYITGLFSRIIGGKSFTIDEKLLRKILVAYNDVIIHHKFISRKLAKILYANNIEDLVVVRMYYDTFYINNSYYLTPTFELTTKSYIEKYGPERYIVVHLFPRKAYGEIRSITEELIYSQLGREVPDILFNKDDIFSSSESPNRTVSLFAITTSSLMIGVVLYIKLRKISRRE